MTDAAEPRPLVAVVVFPGSNDDRDAELALNRLGADARRVWHSETSSPTARQASSSPVGSPTATTSAAARSPASRRS